MMVRSKLAVVILRTYSASSDQFTSSCIKTGERRIIRLDELNLSVRHRHIVLFRQTKQTAYNPTFV